MKPIIVVSVAAMLLSACASQNADTSKAAEPVAAPAVAATTATATKSGKLVCQPAPTGTRIAKKKLCMTQEEWDANRAASQEATRNMQQGVVTERQQ